MRYLITVLLLSTVTTAHAQDRKIARAGLPHRVAEHLQAIADDPATRVIRGEADLAGEHVGDVASFDGPLTLSGRIDGNLIVIDGNVHFLEGAAVTGDVFVINGEATGVESAVIGGAVTTYGEGFGPRRGKDRNYAVNSRSKRAYRDDWRRDWGHSSFTVTTGWNYNRVEGLPVMFGPEIQTGGRNPLRIEALAIWRTEVSSPWDTDDLGYRARVEQFFGGRRDFRVGVGMHSVIDPIEDWQLSRAEASLATFVLHQDYHDYFEREGWSAYLKYAPRATGFSASLEYRDESHGTQPVRDPWTVFDRDQQWRLQPLVADGELRSINGAFELDRRNDEDFPSQGFLLRGEVTHGLDVDLGSFNDNFTSGLLDARLYRPVGRNSALALRLIGAGALHDVSLAPQFQRALGGPGSLPGYASFAADCGARSAIVENADGDVFFPAYGCDRTALLSAEYRGGFDFRWEGFDSWHNEDDDWEDSAFEASPNWVVFFDAARGWSRSGDDTETLYDAGLGILLGDLGIYGAVPLSGTDRSLRFFVRLGPRF